MEDTLEFHQEALVHASHQFTTAQLAADQQQIINALAHVICQMVPINEKAMGGFVLQALILWQKQYKRPASDIAVMVPAERVEAVDQVAGFLKQEMEKALFHKASAQKLRQAVDNAVTHYRQHFANR